jgi:hypothetical protein
MTVHGGRTVVWAGVLATLAAVAVACGGSRATPTTASPVPPPATPSPATTPPPSRPSPATTEALSPGQTGLRVVSVVPPPGATGPWVGQQVHVGYLPAGARVDPARCRLFVDDVRQRAPARVVFIAPADPILIFSWKRPYAPGEYRFRVEVRTAAGGTATYTWRYTYR